MDLILSSARSLRTIINGFMYFFIGPLASSNMSVDRKAGYILHVLEYILAVLIVSLVRITIIWFLILKGLLSHLNQLSPKVGFGFLMATVLYLALELMTMLWKIKLARRAITLRAGFDAVKRQVILETGSYAQEVATLVGEQKNL